MSLSKIRPNRLLLAAALALVFQVCLFGVQETKAVTVLPDRFAIEKSDIHLSRPATPGTYFDKVGRRFAVLGFESGTFEAWAYPLKILRNFEFSFLTGMSTTPIRGRDIVRFIDVEPEATTLTFIYQSFTVRAHYVTDIEEGGAVILLEVDSTEPLTIVCGFLPVLQPMWPAGLGGQYAYWDENMNAYLISEPTRKNHAYVGSPAARGISYTPAHMLSDSPNEFKIEVAEPGKARSSYLPVILAGGKGEREEIKASYQRLASDPEGCYRRARRHFEAIRKSTLQIRTPDSRINLAFEWAKIALDNLFVDNPDLGRGLVAGLGPSGTGGRPGFGWFFGGDAYLNSFSLNSLGMFETARQALVFTGKWQRKDGKMAHELSQAAGYLKWWDDYPYGYIHGDTTPFYIVAAEDYYRRTGDIHFLRSAWPSLIRAYDWCLTTDADGDGLMDNSRAGLGALEFGSLTGIQTDIYLAAVWVKANQAMEKLAEAMGDEKKAAASAARFGKASKAWDEKFWDGSGGFYSFAFNKNGQLVRELTPWSAVGLAWEFGSPEKGIRALAAINGPELTTDWGIRMLSEKSSYFEPLNYNYGACWPFLSGWVAAALFRLGFVCQGAVVLAANVNHTFDNSLGVTTELYSGFQNSWPQEGVPHQGFSTTGLVLPVTRGLLGLEADVPGKKVRIRPAVPADWPGFMVYNWRVGDADISVNYGKEKTMVKLWLEARDAAGFKAVFKPCLAPGSLIKSASLNGKDIAFKSAGLEAGQSVGPEVEFAVSGNDLLVIEFSPGLEIVPPVTASRPGDVNRGLKILRTDAEGDTVGLSVAGPAGKAGELEINNPDIVEHIEGAALDGRKLKLNFPSGKGYSFSAVDIKVRLKR